MSAKFIYQFKKRNLKKFKDFTLQSFSYKNYDNLLLFNIPKFNNLINELYLFLIIFRQK